MNEPDTLEHYFLITEKALDLILLQRAINSAGMPEPSMAKGLFVNDLSKNVRCFATLFESERPYAALVAVKAFREIAIEANFACQDIYARIARVVKGMKKLPIHLPRPWSEFHYKNRIAFFATPRTSGNFRWIADTNMDHQCVRFSSARNDDAQDLAQCELSGWPEPWQAFSNWIIEIKATRDPEVRHESLVEEVDLETIGSGSVVQNRTYEAWQSFLSDEQKRIINQEPKHSVRIIGPAGSGKTLALCLRAIRIASDESTATQAKKILMVTHSWAMAERIDGIVSILNGGIVPNSITILPLLYVLKEHGGQIGRQDIDVIGDDSKGGRIAALEIIKDILSEKYREAKRSVAGLSEWISSALASAQDSRATTELALNIYDEFTGVLAAGGVAFDDSDSIKLYLKNSREDWMPPFESISDRKLVLEIYRLFIGILQDKGAITTDQFVLDTIRVLETFTWRMRRETEGYDYILIDELQLFDSQERLALELLGRSRKGIPFCTAEDPSQGVFSALHTRRASSGIDDSVYLDSVHRFDTKIFEFIKFIYQKFPLNTIPLRIDPKKTDAAELPKAYLCADDYAVIPFTVEHVERLAANLLSNGTHGRISIVTLGDVDDLLRRALEEKKMPVVQLRSFDDVEQLAYSRKAIVVSPWEYIGGMQFSHVVVVAAGITQATTSFERLRALTALYLACSRAAVSLDIICGDCVPPVIEEAIDAGYIAALS